MNVSLLVAQCRANANFYETLKAKYSASLDEYVENGGGGIITAASTNGLSVTVQDGTTLEDFCSILAKVINEVETGVKPQRVLVGRFQ